MATLVVIYAEDAQVGRAFPLPLHEVTVGRAKRCGVHIHSRSVSKRHARIYFDGDACGWVVEDLRSTNGCFVNHMPVAKSVLCDGDKLEIGGVIFKFRAAGASEIPSGADEGDSGSGASALVGS